MNSKNFYLWLWGLVPVIAAPIFTNQFLPKITYLFIIVLIFAIILYKKRADLTKNGVHKTHVLWLLFLVLAIGNTGDSIDQLMYWVLLLSIHFIFSYLKTSEIKAVLISLIASGTICALYGLSQFLVAKSLHSFPTHISFFSHMNAAGAFMSATVIITFGFLIFSQKNTLSFALLIIAFVIQVSYLTVTYNRAGWLACLAGVCVLLLFTLVKHSQNKAYVSKIILFFLFLAIGCCLLVWSSETLSQRFMSIVDLENTSNKVRILLWNSAFDMTSQYPWFGVGTGNFVDYFPMYRNPLEYQISSGRVASHPHNTFLLISSENGFIGCTLFLLLILSTFIGLWKISKNEETQIYLGAISLLVAIVVTMLFFATLTIPVIGFLFAGITGLSCHSSTSFKYNLPASMLLLLLIVGSCLGTYISCGTTIADAYFNLGQKKMIARDFEGAIQDFTTANRFFENEIVHLEMGRCFLAEKKYHLAQKSLEKALSPNHLYLENAYLNLGITYIYQQKSKEAMDLWLQAITIYPKSFLLNYNLAKLLLELNETKDAIVYFEKANSIDPKIANDFDYLMNMGLAYEKLDELRAALNYYIKAKNLDENRMLARLHMAQIFVKLQLYPSALHHLEVVAQKGTPSENLSANLAMANIYETIRQNEIAITIYFKVIQQNKNNYVANFSLGKLLFFQQKYSMAEKFLQHSLQLNTQNPWINILLALIYLEQQNYKEGESHLNQASTKGFKEWSQLLNIEHISEETKEFVRTFIK